MQVYNAIVIEDEPLAAELIGHYIQKTPMMKLVGDFRNPILAETFLQDNSVDVIFLDIHLPQLNGMEFLRRNVGLAQYILTTAYPQFALKSYDYNVVDYLLKPIEYDRFEQAVNKLVDTSKAFFIELKVHQFIRRINTREIIYIESDRDYVRLYLTSSGMIRSKITLKEVKDLLPDDFLQIHRSFIVNRQHIRSHSATEVILASGKLTIGRKFRSIVAIEFSNNIN